jgi:hypothetical protein
MGRRAMCAGSGRFGGRKMTAFDRFWRAETAADF